MIIDADGLKLPEKTPLRQALEVLENSKIKILLVVDENERLVGTATDGDFRRAVIKGLDLQTPLGDICNRKPFTVEPEDDFRDVKRKLRVRNLLYTPAIDSQGRVVGLFDYRDKPQPEISDVPVMIMAGGLGKRLLPLTETTPKPLLPLGNKPILQHILERLRDQGFRKFYISIRYLGHMIENYFGNGESLGLDIEYVRETDRLGTAGALHHLPDDADFPMLVMNADLVSETDFREMVKHHIDTQAAATMAVREHINTIQFGVVRFDGDTYVETDEKPSQSYFINAGVYCLSQDAMDVVPEDQFYNMPSLFDELAGMGQRVNVFQLRDTWIDIGTHQQYDAAQARFAS